MMNEPTDPRHWLTYVPATLERLSPLYAHLYRHIREDPEIFALFSLIDPDQPIPVLFFSVVNFLVLAHPHEELAQFYPYVNPSPPSPWEAYPFFRAFCLSHLDALNELLPAARLQTNEVTRCANLLPAFQMVWEQGSRRPLSLIEIGSSAGLHLNIDRYRYTYDQLCSLGDERSPVHIACAFEGDGVPPIPSRMPEIAQRVGIDLAPLDIHNEGDVRWLRSCIWPEELHRYRLLDAAIEVARQHPPRLLTGNAPDLLPDLLAAVPIDHTICLWHSFALNQGPASVQEQVTQQLIEASSRRPIYRVSIEANPLKRGRPRLEFFLYRNSDLFQYQWLAECDFHGERMQWYAPLA